ncbi:hypothetical protein [Mariniblastus fucicola]|uniref:hypothetical protein n=1 Tax=Mariniblastus fucicola TaxID=980251 RepID=UPI0011DF78A0|nr:hypothetical protein [Mariniblastus fucicola]
MLRDLDRIRGVSVTAVNDEFLELSSGQKLGWDKVLQAQVDPAWQDEVDRRISQFGLPLFRLKHRLQQKSFSGAFEIASRWYENGEDDVNIERQFAGDEANFLVCRAMMLGYIGRGETEKAVEPMIRALLRQEECSAAFLESFSELAFSKGELEVRVCDGYLPVWSSAEAATAELDRLESCLDLDQLAQRWPGLAVYFSSLAVHASRRQRMTAWSPAMASVPELRRWQRVLGSDMSRMPLSRLVADTEGGIRVATMFWWATDQDQQASAPERVLTLLKIVANYQSQFPVIANLARKRAIELTADPHEQVLLQEQGKSVRKAGGR